MHWIQQKHCFLLEFLLNVKILMLLLNRFFILIFLPFLYDNILSSNYSLQPVMVVGAKGDLQLLVAAFIVLK